MRSETDGPYVELRIPLHVAESAIAALSEESIRLHGYASKMQDDPEKAQELRAQADEKHEALRSLRNAVIHCLRWGSAVRVHNHGAVSEGQGNSAASANISDRGGTAIAIIALMVACVALGMVVMLPDQQAARVEVLGEQANKAEREARVMQERWNDLKVELAKRQIPVSDH